MEEYFDVVDKDRNPINKKLIRGTTLSKNEFNTGVEIWILNDKKELLITQRSLQKSHPLMWECPGGCSISGETSNQTILREIKEEIGLELDFSNNIELIATSLYKQQFVDIYFLRLNVNLEKLQLQKEEIADAKIVSLLEFEKMNAKGEIVPAVYERYNIIKEIINSKI